MSETTEKAEANENVCACNTCEHYESGEKCKAFAFIPDLILLGYKDHTTQLEGQENKVIFEPIKTPKK
jgi:hypothetical protein